MSVWNEYDKLKTIFIGKRYDEDITYDVFKDKCSQKDLDAWQQINFETNQDLDIIEDFLRKKGVKVYRPDISRYWHIKKTAGQGASEPLDPGPVRDWCFTYGDLIILTQLSFPSRQNEHIFWEDAFDDLIEKGKNVISLKFNTSLNYENHLYFYKTNKFLKNDYRDDISEIYHEVKKHKKFQGSANLCLKYLNSEESIDENFYIYVLVEEYRRKNFIHAASYFKHNNKIYGSPQGTLKGISLLEKTVKSFYPETEFHYIPEMAHIDGLQMLVDEDLRVVNVHGKFVNPPTKFTTIKDETWGGLTSFFLDTKNVPKEQLVPEKFFRQVEEIFDTQNGETIHAQKYLWHWTGMRGYYQEVDFDMNGLCIAPREMIGNFFDKNNKDIIEKELNIKIHNMPLRHRLIFDSGIHCYTQDIDREK